MTKCIVTCDLDFPHKKHIEPLETFLLQRHSTSFCQPRLENYGKPSVQIKKHCVDSVENKTTSYGRSFYSIESLQKIMNLVKIWFSLVGRCFTIFGRPGQEKAFQSSLPPPLLAGPHGPHALFQCWLSSHGLVPINIERNTVCSHGISGWKFSQVYFKHNVSPDHYSVKTSL